jgi:hypothetical protein
MSFNSSRDQSSSISLTNIIFGDLGSATKVVFPARVAAVDGARQRRALTFAARAGTFRSSRDRMLFRHIAAILTFACVLGARAGQNELTPAEQKAGWKLLFDGQTTKGWRGFKKDAFPEKGWIVEGGELRLQAGSKAGDIVTESTFSDFDVSWEWKLPPGANNGLKYFISEERSGAIGHEYQMIDDASVKESANGGERSTASFYEVLPPAKDKPLKKPGEWNHSRILVHGNHVEHWLNGRKVLEYELGSEEVLKAVQNSKFRTVPGFGTKLKGHILLTYHHDPVAYRNIKIREMKD